jgi:hypothetical protein
MLTQLIGKSLTSETEKTIEDNINKKFWVGSGKLLLAFASTVILCSGLRGTHDHRLLSMTQEVLGRTDRLLSFDTRRAA